MTSIATLLTGTDTVAGAKTRLIDIQRSHLKHSLYPVINKTGGALTAPRTVKVTGFDATSALPTVDYAAASDLPTAQGLLLFEEITGSETSLPNNSVGFVMDEGFCNMDTSGYSTNDPLWLTSSGAFTNVYTAGMLPIARVVVAAAKGSGGTIYYNRNGIKTSDGNLIITPFYLGGIGTGTQNRYIFQTPGKVRIKKAYLLSDTATSGSDGSNKYTFQVRNMTDSLDLELTAKTTNGAEIAASTQYDLGIDQNQVIASGKVIRFQSVKTGSPTDLSTALITLVIELEPTV